MIDRRKNLEYHNIFFMISLSDNRYPFCNIYFSDKYSNLVANRLSLLCPRFFVFVEASKNFIIVFLNEIK